MEHDCVIGLLYVTGNPKLVTLREIKRRIQRNVQVL